LRWYPHLGVGEQAYTVLRPAQRPQWESNDTQDYRCPSQQTCGAVSVRIASELRTRVEHQNRHKGLAVVTRQLLLP
jgi:hypothetical protein